MTRIVVLGAGYGGLVAAIRLQRQVQGHAQVTVIAASDRFEERIRLHQAAVGQVLPTLSITGFLEGTGVSFVQARVRQLEPARRALVLESGERVAYDFLIYAPGSRLDLDALPGLRAHAVGLDGATLSALRDRLPALAARGGRVVVCGTGLSGLEGATELAERFPELRVTLVGAGRLDAGYTVRGARHLRRTLARLRIELIEERAIREVRAGELVTDGEPVPFDLCLWAGGLVAPELARAAGLPVNAHGQLVVDATLRSVGDPHIYGAGDAAHVEGHQGSPLHMACKTAVPTGAHAADNLSARVLGRAERPFNFRDAGVCISLGRRDGLIQVRRPDGSPWFAITGKLAAWLKEQVCLYTVRAIDRERRGKPYRWLHVKVPAALAETAGPRQLAA
jgi:NADH:ubiquinone reductase (H+-translocating)